LRSLLVLSILNVQFYINARYLTISQAIRAAIRKKVHIISMSWTIEPPDDDAEKRELESAIIDAASADILMFCSASDSGAKHTSTYPSRASTNIFNIGGADATGTPMKSIGNVMQMHFLFPGNKVESEYLEDVKPKETEYRTGSSVATALAAGLAALILYCVQVRILRGPTWDKDKARKEFNALKKYDNMKMAFRNIGTTDESNNKYITVWDLFGKKVTESESDSYDRSKWIDLVVDVGTTLCMKVK
jgi:hypothetical protein